MFDSKYLDVEQCVRTSSCTVLLCNMGGPNWKWFHGLLHCCSSLGMWRSEWGLGFECVSGSEKPCLRFYGIVIEKGKWHYIYNIYIYIMHNLLYFISATIPIEHGKNYYDWKGWVLYLWQYSSLAWKCILVGNFLSFWTVCLNSWICSSLHVWNYLKASLQQELTVRPCAIPSHL